MWLDDAHKLDTTFYGGKIMYVDYSVSNKVKLL